MLYNNEEFYRYAVFKFYQILRGLNLLNLISEFSLECFTSVYVYVNSVEGKRIPHAQTQASYTTA